MSFGSLLAFAVLGVALTLTCVRPPDGHYDFNLRMNELVCVRLGVNPHAVWHGDIELKPFYANTHKGPVPEGCSKQVNAYAPWAYVYMLPISLLPEVAEWSVYCLLMALCVVGIGMMSAREYTSGTERTIELTVPMLVIGYPLFANCSVGNFGVFVLFGAVLMAWALNRGLWWLAGLGWALAMVKPQLGLLFAIPLLLRRRFATCAVAGGVCLAATVAMSIVLKTPVVDLLLQGPAANTEFFQGCGTWPKFLCGTFGVERDILIGMGVGAVVCFALTWMVRREGDWFVLLMPAAICGCSWTYASNYCQAMGWFLAFVLVRELVRNPQSKFLWTMLALSAFFLSRWFLAWHGLCAFASWRFPMSEYAFRCVDSLNSTASLVLTAVFCVWRWRHEGCTGSHLLDVTPCQPDSRFYG